MRAFVTILGLALFFAAEFKTKERIEQVAELIANPRASIDAANSGWN